MRTARKLSPCFFVVFVAMLTLGIVPAQTTNVSTTNPAATAACGQYFEDGSGSPAAAEILDLRLKITAKLPEIAAKAGIDCWGFFNFYENSFSAPELVRVDFRLNTMPPCHAVNHTEMGSLIAAIARTEEKEQAQNCEQERKNKEDEWNRKAAASVDAARRALSRDPPKGRCTAIADLLERISMDNDPSHELEMIITDGQELCRQRPIASIPAPAIKRRVLMLVVGLASEKTGAANGFRARRDFWHGVAPWVEVVPAFNVDAALAAIH